MTRLVPGQASPLRLELRERTRIKVELSQTEETLIKSTTMSPVSHTDPDPLERGDGAKTITCVFALRNIGEKTRLVRATFIILSLIDLRIRDLTNSE